MICDGTITRILVKSSEVTFLAIHTKTWLCKVLSLDGSVLDRSRCFILSILARMVTVFERHGTNCSVPGNSSQMFQAMKSVLRSMPTAKILAILDRTFTIKFSTRLKSRMGPSLWIGFSIALRNFDAGWLSSLCSRSSWISLSLIMLSLASLSRRQVLCCNLLGQCPAWVRNLYVRFQKSNTIGDVTGELYSSTNGFFEGRILRGCSRFEVCGCTEAALWWGSLLWRLAFQCFGSLRS